MTSSTPNIDLSGNRLHGSLVKYDLHSSMEEIAVVQNFELVNQQYLYLKMPKIFTMAWIIVSSSKGTSSNNVYWSSFMVNGVPLAIGIDPKSKYVTLCNLREKGYVFRQPGVSMKITLGLTYFIAIQFDFVRERISVYCNNVLIIKDLHFDEIHLSSRLETVVSRVLIGHPFLLVKRFTIWRGDFAAGHEFFKISIEPYIELSDVTMTMDKYETRIDNFRHGMQRFSFPDKTYTQLLVRFNYEEPPEMIFPRIKMSKDIESKLIVSVYDSQSFLVEISYGDCDFESQIQAELMIPEIWVELVWNFNCAR